MYHRFFQYISQRANMRALTTLSFDKQFHDFKSMGSFACLCSRQCSFYIFFAILVACLSVEAIQMRIGGLMVCRDQHLSSCEVPCC